MTSVSRSNSERIEEAVWPETGNTSGFIEWDVFHFLLLYIFKAGLTDSFIHFIISVI